MGIDRTNTLSRDAIEGLKGLAAREAIREDAPQSLSSCFVKLNYTAGNDLAVVNAARVSMGKRSYDCTAKDERLIKYLIDHIHTSPFRHQTISFHIRAPIFVLRQWMKHQVGCAWNEMSLRYVEHDGSAWKPEQWRGMPPKSIKQGSGDPIARQDEAHEIYASALDSVFKAYEDLLALGVAREQARMILPMSTLTECWWTCSLQAALHFLRLRSASDAQSEIQWFADEVRKIIETQYPASYKAWSSYHQERDSAWRTYKNRMEELP